MTMMIGLTTNIIQIYSEANSFKMIANT